MSKGHRELPEDRQTLSQLRRISRRGFAGYVAGLGAMVLGIRWIGTQSESAGISWPLRFMHDLNEKVWHNAVGTSALAPEFAPSQAGEPRANGMYGLLDENDSAWELRVEVEDWASDPLTMDDIKSLPRVEQITEFKCIEGWSEVVAWSGCRFSDLARIVKPPEKLLPLDHYPYVSLSTPNGGYYVGLDISSAMHPQSLLAYEMNGKPLTAKHGAPLRLVIPVKYGIKNIKRIGTIRFTRQKPADYWAERGYDWYAGL